MPLDKVNRFMYPFLLYSQYVWQVRNSVRKYVYKAFCQTLPTPVAECGWILFFLDSPKFQDFKMAYDSTALSN